MPLEVELLWSQTKSINKAREAVIKTLELMEVSAVNPLILQAALASNLRDFEDAVQLACALGDRLWDYTHEVITEAKNRGATFKENHTDKAKIQGLRYLVC